MSAQALLASILPVAPAPQGSAAPAVAEEGAEFAAMVETEAKAAQDDVATASAEDSFTPAPAPATDEAPTDAAVPIVSLIVVAPEVPVVVPVVIQATVANEDGAPSDEASASPASASTPTVVPEADLAPTPMPAQTALTGQGVPPQNQTRKAEASAPSVDAAPVIDEAKTPEGEAPPPETGSKAKGEPPAAPPPLKPLPERTSRPVEPGQPALDSASRAEGQRPEGAATPQAPGTPAIPAAASAQGQIKAGRAEPIAASDASTPTSIDAAPAETPAAPDHSAAAQVRDTAAGLSRVAIEATAQIAAQILRKLEGRSTRFEMALLPEELGRVDVKLDIDSEGRLNARLAFDNPAAALDLRGRVDDLRRQLEQHGFELAADAFEFAERDPGSHAFDRGQEHPGRGRAFAAAARLEADAEVAVVGRYNVSLSPSGVDVRV